MDSACIGLTSSDLVTFAGNSTGWMPPCQQTDRLSNDERAASHPASALEINQHREHPAIGVCVGRKAEFGEDAPDRGLDRLDAQM